MAIALSTSKYFIRIIMVKFLSKWAGPLLLNLF